MYKQSLSCDKCSKDLGSSEYDEDYNKKLVSKYVVTLNYWKKGNVAMRIEYCKRCFVDIGNYIRKDTRFSYRKKFSISYLN